MGKKSTALVVETKVLDHWGEASGFLSFSATSPHGEVSSASAECVDPHIAPTTAAGNEQISLQHSVHVSVAEKHEAYRALPIELARTNPWQAVMHRRPELTQGQWAHSPFPASA